MDESLLKIAIGAIVIVRFLASCSGRTHAEGCNRSAIVGTWNLELADPAGMDSIVATIDLGASGGSVHGVDIRREGSREPVDFPVEALTVREDSVKFKFAPIGLI